LSDRRGHDLLVARALESLRIRRAYGKAANDAKQLSISFKAREASAAIDGVL
jgi:hypothetical protein